jgi:hypothetical protein
METTRMKMIKVLHQFLERFASRLIEDEATISLANSLILLTHNTREFELVDELQLEDWELDS